MYSIEYIICSSSGIMDVAEDQTLTQTIRHPMGQSLLRIKFLKMSQIPPRVSLILLVLGVEIVTLQLENHPITLLQHLAWRELEEIILQINLLLRHRY